MYYQFDSRLNMPAIMFDDDRIVVAGKEYYYTDLLDVEITKAPLLSTYGIMELRTPEKPVPVPFAKADIHRLRTAVQEARHLIQTYAQRKAEEDAQNSAEAAADRSVNTDPVVPEDEHRESAQKTAAEALYSYGKQETGMDPYEEMKKLKELLDLDIITQEEFAQKKKELLGL